MAINPGTRYPAQTTAPDANYTWGSAKNVAIPGDGTGTPWEKDLVNDLFGFFQEMLTVVAASPSGSPETVGASQIADAIRSLISAPIDETTGGFTKPQSDAGGSDYKLMWQMATAAGPEAVRVYSLGDRIVWAYNAEWTGAAWEPDTTSADARAITFHLGHHRTQVKYSTVPASWTSWDATVENEKAGTTGKNKVMRTALTSYEYITRGTLSHFNTNAASKQVEERAFIPWGRELVDVLITDCTVTRISSSASWPGTPTVVFADNFGCIVENISASIPTSTLGYVDFSIVVSK